LSSSEDKRLSTGSGNLLSERIVITILVIICRLHILLQTSVTLHISKGAIFSVYRIGLKFIIRYNFKVAVLCHHLNEIFPSIMISK